MTRNFSAFHASCTVCNVNFSQLIKITNSCSLLPLPHFIQKGSDLGRQFRVYRMLSQNFSQIYLCRNFHQSLKTVLNCNCYPKPVISFVIPFCVRSAFHFFLSTFVPFRVIAPVRSYIPFRSSKSKISIFSNDIFLSLFVYMATDFTNSTYFV